MGRLGFSFLIIAWCLKPFKMQKYHKTRRSVTGQTTRSPVGPAVSHSSADFNSKMSKHNTKLNLSRCLSMFSFMLERPGAYSPIGFTYWGESWAQSPQTGRRRHYVEFKIRGFWRYKHVDEFSHSLLKVTVINVCRPDFPGFTRAVKMSIQYVRI